MSCQASALFSSWVFSLLWLLLLLLVLSLLPVLSPLLLLFLLTRPRQELGEQHAGFDEEYDAVKVRRCRSSRKVAARLRHDEAGVVAELLAAVESVITDTPGAASSSALGGMPPAAASSSALGGMPPAAANTSALGGMPPDSAHSVPPAAANTSAQGGLLPGAALFGPLDPDL